jgi:poly(hydroxyalkanoate) granule-associated protein
MTTTKKRRARRAKPAPAAPTAQQALKEGWQRALHALKRAEAQVETRVKALLRSNKINVEDAGELLREFKQGVAKERARGLRELDARLAELRKRVRREGRNVAKAVDDTVQSGLAALNIPSRREVALLTRKVDELSRRIATLRRKRR